MDELGRGYEALLNTEVGINLVKWLNAERKSSYERAEKSNDPHVAFGLLKTAHAYTIVLTHLETMASSHKVKSKIVSPRQDGT